MVEPRDEHMMLRRVWTFVHPMLAESGTRRGVFAAFALLAGAWIATFAIPMLPGDAVLVTHYTTTFGVDALGGWTDLVRLPATGTILIALNLGLAFALTPRDAPESTPASRMLVAASAAIAGVVLVGTVLLLHMNTVTGSDPRASSLWIPS